MDFTRNGDGNGDIYQPKYGDLVIRTTGIDPSLPSKRIYVRRSVDIVAWFVVLLNLKF